MLRRYHAFRTLRKGAAKPHARPRPANDAGFTVSEVVIALAILSLGLGFLLNTIGNGLRYTSRGGHTAQAVSLAQSLLAEVGSLRPLIEGQSTGDAGAYRWQLSIQFFGDRTEQQAWPLGAYSVAAQVFWGDDLQQRSYTLKTLRIGPKEAAR